MLRLSHSSVQGAIDQAETVKTAGTTLMAIGFGSGCDIATLNAMATSPASMYAYKGTDIADVQQHLSDMCTIVASPRAPPPPSPPIPCDHISVEGFSCSNGYGLYTSDRAHGVNAQYSFAGNTADGRPIYQNTISPNLHLFYDTNCGVRHRWGLLAHRLVHRMHSPIENGDLKPPGWDKRLLLLRSLLGRGLLCTRRERPAYLSGAARMAPSSRIPLLLALSWYGHRETRARTTVPLSLGSASARTT